LPCVFALFAAAPAAAHTRSTSYSSFEIQGREARIVLHTTQLELTRLPWGPVAPPDLDPGLARYWLDHLVLRAGDRPCSPVSEPRALAAQPGDAAFEWRVACPADGALAIESTLFLEVHPGHLHFVRVRGAGSGPMDRVLSAESRSWRIEEEGGAAPAQVGSSFFSYLWLGIEHIFTGYDHLAFLVALMLLAARVREVIAIATGFTIAHSLTLAAAVVGWVTPPSVAVEALIGLSIALVAAENSWTAAGRGRLVPAAIAFSLVALAFFGLRGSGGVPPLTLAGLAVFSICYFELVRHAARPMRLRALVAFVFGLVHGFGFAGVLAEIELPTNRLVAALLGFNLGVEAGQIAVLTVLWPLLLLAARLGDGRLHRAAVEGGSAAIAGLGLFWFLTRAYAG
jgi:hypothetical protein